MAKTKRLTRALVLRDAALTLVNRLGTYRWFGPSKVLFARIGQIEIGYRRLSGLQEMPYGLDVWAPNKVLNIEWDHRDNVELVSLRPGAWEAELIALAKSVADTETVGG
jgi:hypothetical protein